MPNCNNTLPKILFNVLSQSCSLILKLNHILEIIAWMPVKWVQQLIQHYQRVVNQHSIKMKLNHQKEGKVCMLMNNNN